jgi:hypothetical protein
MGVTVLKTKRHSETVHRKYMALTCRRVAQYMALELRAPLPSVQTELAADGPLAVPVHGYVHSLEYYGNWGLLFKTQICFRLYFTICNTVCSFGVSFLGFSCMTDT